MAAKFRCSFNAVNTSSKPKDVVNFVRYADILRTLIPTPLPHRASSLDDGGHTHVRASRGSCRESPRPPTLARRAASATLRRCAAGHAELTAFETRALACRGKATLHVTEALSILADHEAQSAPRLLARRRCPKSPRWNRDACAALVGPPSRQRRVEINPSCLKIDLRPPERQDRFLAGSRYKKAKQNEQRQMKPHARLSDKCGPQQRGSSRGGSANDPAARGDRAHGRARRASNGRSRCS